MIALVGDSRYISDFFAQLRSQMQRVSEQVKVLPYREVLPPATLRTSEDGAMDIAQYAIFRRRLECRDLELTVDDLLERADQEISDLAPHLVGCSAVVTFGCSGLRTRAAMFLAKNMGIPVVCLETACFPFIETTTALTAHYGIANYAVRNEGAFLSKWASWDLHDPERIAKYREWWVANKITKHSAVVVLDETLPESWLDVPPEDRVVAIGQIPYDAAMYWATSPRMLEKMKADIRLLEDQGKTVYFKPHPKSLPAFDEPYYGDLYYHNQLPENASIHAILPDCSTVLVQSSGVGVEAWMLGLDVITYGSPIYAAPGLTRTSVDDPAGWDWAMRMRFADFYMQEIHVNMLDASRLVFKVRSLVSEAAGCS